MTPNDLYVRDAIAQDAAAMVAILNPIIEARGLTAMSSTMTCEEQRDFIQTFPDDGVFLVAVQSTSKHVVGMQDILADHRRKTHDADNPAQISTFIAPDHARHGYGRALFEAMLPRARRCGYTRLIATILKHNTIAQSFYRSIGFEHSNEPAETNVVELAYQLVTEPLCDGSV